MEGLLYWLWGTDATGNSTRPGLSFCLNDFGDTVVGPGGIRIQCPMFWAAFATWTMDLSSSSV